jgi:serine/threonine protein kinase
METQLVLPKKYVNTFLIDTLKQRVMQLQVAKPIAGMLHYDSVEESPLYVTVSCREATDNSLAATKISPLRHPVTEAEAINIIRKLVRVVYRLHRRKFVHGHLSQSNIYECPDGSILIARHVLPPGIFVKGTQPWKDMVRLAAPEIVKGDMFGFPADVWGIGVVLLSIMRPKLMKDYETEDLIDTTVMSPILSTLTPSAVSFAVQCLKIDQLLRPRLDELMLHPFLRDAAPGPSRTLAMLLQPHPPGKATAARPASSLTESGSESEDPEDDPEDEEDEEEDESESDPRDDSSEASDKE